MIQVLKCIRSKSTQRQQTQMDYCLSNTVDFNISDTLLHTICRGFFLDNAQVDNISNVQEMQDEMSFNHYNLLPEYFSCLFGKSQPLRPIHIPEAKRQ